MIDNSIKIAVLEQMVREHEVDLYRSEMNLKIAGAVGRGDLVDQLSAQVEGLNCAIKVLESEKAAMGVIQK